MVLVRFSPAAALHAIVAVLALHAPMAQLAGQPEWVTKLDATKYILLPADFKPPFAYDTDATIDLPTVSQAVKLAEPYVNTAPEPPTEFRWAMTWAMVVDVYENEETAQQVWRDRRRAERENCLGDPRLGDGLGAAVVEPGPDVGGFMYVRYRNLILWISGGRNEDITLHEGGVVDVGAENFAWKDATAYQAPLIADLARLWLDKVAGPAADPGRADLHVEPGWLLLSLSKDNTRLPFEPAADKQSVAFRVQNVSQTTVAKDVYAQLSLGLPGDDRGTPLGDPISVGDLRPLRYKEISTVWDLKGQNVKRGRLSLQVWTPGVDDANPDDNVAGLEVSIYHAHSGDRAFSWFGDAYSFDNFRFEDREIEEIVEGVLATVVGTLSADGDMTEVLKRLLFPQTYTRLQAYLGKSATLAAGGHCYGMAATAALYFEDGSLKPVPKPVPDMSRSEASTNINIYHRAQMAPIIQALITGRSTASRDLGVDACRSAIKQALRDARQCSIIEFFGGGKGHAVLAYKLIEIEGRDPIVYVYDPNFPQAEAQAPRAMPQIRLLANGASWSNPKYMGYAWANAQSISSRRPHRTIPLSEVNALVPDLKKALYDMIALMEKGNKLMALLGCPADLVFTDAQGRRTGTVGGEVINEIPGAEVRSEGEVEIYLLPSNLQYAVSITGTARGEAGFDIITAESATEAGLTSFDALPITAGGTATSSLMPGGKIDAFVAGGRTIAPALVATLGADDAIWKTRPADDVEQPSRPGRLIACRSIDDGKPVGSATRFEPLQEVWCYHDGHGLPAGTVNCVWRRDGREISRTERQIGEQQGWIGFMLGTTRDGGLPSGLYQVTIEIDGPDLETDFTITDAAAGNTEVDAQAGEFHLTGPDASFAWTNGYPAQGGTLSLSYRCRKPGTIIDSVGVGAAQVGDFALTHSADGSLCWQIFNPGVQSACRDAGGWHRMVAAGPVTEMEWHRVEASWGLGGMKLVVDGDEVGSDEASLPLSGKPMFIGDFPNDGDARQSMRGKIRNMQVTE